MPKQVKIRKLLDEEKLPVKISSSKKMTLKKTNGKSQQRSKSLELTNTYQPQRFQISLAFFCIVSMIVDLQKTVKDLSKEGIIWEVGAIVNWL